MNRRLFVGQVIGGASLLSVPSSLIAHSLSPPSSQTGTIALSRNALNWVENGSLGTLKHITLSHVYSPKHTSLPALMAMVQKDIAEINTLLGTSLSLTDQALVGGGSSAFGTYSTQIEKAGVKITWQGLARIGGEAKKPVGRLRIHGSKGIIQAQPDGDSYQLIKL